MYVKMPNSKKLLAFGKFRPGNPPKQARFEIVFGIRCGNSNDKWKSRYLCIQNLLDHLRRYTQSESSRQKYLNHLLQFCEKFGIKPSELTKFPKKRVEQLIQRFADEKAAEGKRQAAESQCHNLSKVMSTL